MFKFPEQQHTHKCTNRTTPNTTTNTSTSTPSNPGIFFSIAPHLTLLGSGARKNSFVYFGEPI
jgi:hypothetical protein